MTQARYRSREADEVPAAVEVFLTSVADLARRSGLPAPSAYSHATVDPVYRHLRELRLVSASHLLRTAPFGALERYLPSGPALF